MSKITIFLATIDRISAVFSVQKNYLRILFSDNAWFFHFFLRQIFRCTSKTVMFFQETNYCCYLHCSLNPSFTKSNGLNDSSIHRCINHKLAGNSSDQIERFTFWFYYDKSWSVIQKSKIFFIISRYHYFIIISRCSLNLFSQWLGFGFATSRTDSTTLHLSSRIYAEHLRWSNSKLYSQKISCLKNYYFRDFL